MFEPSIYEEISTFQLKLSCFMLLHQDFEVLTCLQDRFKNRESVPAALLISGALADLKRALEMMSPPS